MAEDYHAPKKCELEATVDGVRYSLVEGPNFCEECDLFGECDGVDGPHCCGESVCNMLRVIFKRKQTPTDMRDYYNEGEKYDQSRSNH